MGSTKNLTIEQVRRQIHETGGNLAAMAREFDVHVTALRAWLENRPALLQELDDARGKVARAVAFSPDPTEFLQVAREYEGETNKIAKHYGVQTRQVYYYLEKQPAVAQELQKLRKQLAVETVGFFDPDPQLMIKAIN